MFKLICEKPQRIIKNKERLEKILEIKIANRGREIIIHGSAENEYVAERVVEALDFGFPFSVALLIKEQDFMLEFLSIKNYTKRKDLERVRARIIGKDGKTLKTLNSLNEIFARNFSQISTKGKVSLELENPKEPFEAGVSILVKTGHGKYLDVTSLSGGEQTLVAISLIFAIQELSPYYFYILDEIDAALDKRNSERLASLLHKYMQKGQYIVISHNDEIISNATNIYGVSMHDGISKVISLKV